MPAPGLATGLVAKIFVYQIGGRGVENGSGVFMVVATQPITLWLGLEVGYVSFFISNKFSAASKQLILKRCL